MNEAMEGNRRNWDERVPIHAAFRFYDVDGFKAGRSSLMSIELDEMDDVRGKLLLHLQCHFGMDTISWARMGAKVTGVDFSRAAIDLARSLSDELDIPARFVAANVYDLPDALDEAGQFDVVFTSYGVLGWLPDMSGWARVVAHFLKPGGTFYIVDGHPAKNVFDDEGDDGLRVRYPYFGSSEPTVYEPDGGESFTYTDGDTPLETAAYEWHHSLGEIVTSLAAAGLTIEFLHEFPFSGWWALPGMVRGDDGWWRLPEHNDSVPQLYSIKAHKPIA
jgi:SAM-dependent methyltransferase